MLILLSPAKTLDFESPLATMTHTQPELLDDSEKLVAVARRLSAPKLMKLMSVSEAIARENVARFKEWSRPFDADNARPAVFAFRGDVYRGLDADTLTKRDLTWAQKRLRILSGLYGVLRPLDLIQPYRLEMGIRLPIGRKKDLYDFWGATITERLNAAIRESKSRVVVNLASNEYFRSVHADALDVPVISPAFKENRNGTLKVISFSAKKARGLMARYIIDNRLARPSDLEAFNVERYRFKTGGSTDREPLFTRPGS